jgi:anti-sigma regulatory factor (Ser/Thr protein kinase)
MHATLRLPAELSRLNQARDYLLEQTKDIGLDARRAARLELALEEIFVNICHYAYPDGGGWVELASWRDVDRFILEIADGGRAFDGSELPDPAIDAPSDAREPGGLGWFLVRRLTDALSSRREHERNIVRLTMQLQPPSPPESPP